MNKDRGRKEIPPKEEKTTKKCPVCNGSGKWRWGQVKPGIYKDNVPCQDCNGSGKIPA